MKLATWNINSIRVRIDRLLAWLDQHQPDVLCLQETKVEDELFPEEQLHLAGYKLAFHGEKSYNGVAILARDAIEDVTRGFGLGDDYDAQSRVIAGTVRGVRVISVYVPNGKTVGHDNYFFKLEWLAKLRAHLDERYDPSQPLVMCGDFNIAPDERDVWNAAYWAGKNLFSEPEHKALEHIKAWGLTDAFRALHPEPGFFSWWDYRMLAFPKGRGLRIDYHLVTQPVMERVVAASIDRNARKGKQPSDHAPVILELRD